MVKYLLITYDEDWADEFNVTGLWVTTDEEFGETLKDVDTEDDDTFVEIYFGTNEAIEVTPHEFTSCLNIHEISAQTYLDLVKTISYKFGTIDIPECLYILSDTTEEDE